MYLYLISQKPELKSKECIKSLHQLNRLYLLLYAFTFVTVLHLGFKAKESFQVLLLLLTMFPPYYFYLRMMSNDVNSLLNRDEWFQNEEEYIKEDPQCKIISQVMHDGIALDEHFMGINYINISVLHTVVNGVVFFIGR